MVKFVKDKLDKLEFELNAINGLALGIQLQLTAVNFDQYQYLQQINKGKRNQYFYILCLIYQAAAAERKEKHATQAPGGSSSESNSLNWYFICMKQ